MTFYIFPQSDDKFQKLKSTFQRSK